MYQHKWKYRNPIRASVFHTHYPSTIEKLAEEQQKETKVRPLEDYCGRFFNELGNLFLMSPKMVKQLCECPHKVSIILPTFCTTTITTCSLGRATETLSPKRVYIRSLRSACTRSRFCQDRAAILHSAIGRLTKRFRKVRTSRKGK